MKKVSSTKKSFEVDICDEDRLSFASLSGDYNPLHVDVEYSKQTNYAQPIMHGAFHAGLLSRMAGMHLPGEKCVLHDISLRFMAPLYTPTKVIVTGQVISDNGEMGTATVSIIDKYTGTQYAEGKYQFGHHKKVISKKNLDLKDTVNGPLSNLGYGKIIVTGATGGIGMEVCSLLGEDALPVSRHSKNNNGQNLRSYSELLNWELGEIAGVVHCAWPEPIETGLLAIDNIENRLDFEITKPIYDIISLARLLRDKGKEGSKIIIIGSTLSRKGSHSWRKPAHSLAKTLVPNLVNILATELAATNHSIIGIELDIIDGGMNGNLTDRQIAMSANRNINGRIANATEIASHIKWIMDNPNKLLSGSVIQLDNSYRN